MANPYTFRLVKGSELTWEELDANFSGSIYSASLSGNTLTLTKGDESTYTIDLTSVGGGSVDTGSLLYSGSISENIITLYSDNQNYNLTVNSPATTITIKNVSGGTIQKGTPCYITGSGTSGNIAGVFPADASNPLRMPAGVVAGETLLDEQEGIGLVDGFISGVNTSLFNAGDSVYVAAGGGYTKTRPTGSNILVQKLGNVEKVSVSNGSGVINGPGYYNDVPNIQTGYLWVGDEDEVAVPIATSSIQNVVSSSYASTASYAPNYVLNSATSSFVTNDQTGSFLTELYVANTAFVDSTYGNDSTGTVGDASKPFATVTAAQTAVSSGQTIIFRPGNHVGTNLGKDGITYYISPGATLTANSGRMFTDLNSGSMSVTVVCDGTMSATAASFCYITQASTFNFKINTATKNTQTPPNELFQITNSSAVLTVDFNRLFNYSSNPWYVFADSVSGCKYYIKGNYCYTTSNFADIDGEGYFKINKIEATFNNANEMLINASNNNTILFEALSVSVTGSNGTLFRANNGGNIIVKNSHIVYGIQSPSYAPLNAYTNGKIKLYNSYVEYNNTAATRPLVGFYSGGSNSTAFFEFYNCQLVHKGQNSTCDGLLLNSGTSPADGNLVLSNTQILLDSTAVGAGAKAIDAGAATLTYKALTDVVSNGAFDGTNLISNTALFVDSNVKSD